MVTRTTSTGILMRLLEGDSELWQPDVARAMLRLDFAPNDHARVTELSEKAQGATLGESERNELEEYLRVADLLALIQARARIALKKEQGAA